MNNEIAGITNKNLIGVQSLSYRLNKKLQKELDMDFIKFLKSLG